MSFNSIEEFIAMGTHGPYVWSSYGLAVLVIGGLFLSLRRERRRVLADLRHKIRKEEAENP